MIRYLGNVNGIRRQLIGPSDEGRLMTLEEFKRAREEAGFVYELIDGVLNVSPTPSPAHQVWVKRIQICLDDYARAHPEHLDFVTERCDVPIPGRPGPSRPQPDLAAFRDFPQPAPRQWDDLCPIVVVEVISERRAKKDTVRNRQLYWLARGITEYWIIDPRKDPQKPTLTALVRQPGHSDWIQSEIPFGKSHRSAALPRFTINLKRAAAKVSRK